MVNTILDTIICYELIMINLICVTILLIIIIVQFPIWWYLKLARTDDSVGFPTPMRFMLRIQYPLPK